jgi:drug/metabolite transporter (DMT)-like permease
MSNPAALIMPFALMYLISKLPRPARAKWWSYVILVAVAVYFGFFFLNFLISKIDPGSDLSFW